MPVVSMRGPRERGVQRRLETLQALHGNSAAHTSTVARGLARRHGDSEQMGEDDAVSAHQRQSHSKCSVFAMSTTSSAEADHI